MRKHKSSPGASRRAAVLALVVIMVPVLFILAGFAINLSYIQYVQTRSQIATDACASVAGRVYAMTGDQEAAIEAAKDVAARNPISTKVLR